MDPNNPNLYTYCRNNPLIYVDPTGQWNENSVWYKPWTWFYKPNNSESGGNSSNTGGGASTQTSTSNSGNTSNQTSTSNNGNTLSNWSSSSTGTSSGLELPSITYYSFNNTFDAAGSIQWKVDMYLNENGDMITISTIKIGNTFDQSYTIQSANGLVVREEKLEYVSGICGVSNQRNVIAVEGFVSGATYSRAIMIVVNREGTVGAWQGSTLPKDPEKYATIAETETGKPLRMTKGMHYGSKAKYEAIIFNDNDPVATTVPNPNEDSKYFGLYLADHIHLHSAFSDTNTGSAGCQTIRPFDDGSKYNTTRGVGWNTFYKAVGGTDAKIGDFLGYYYLIRL
jgi:hypothetical protein